MSLYCKAPFVSLRLKKDCFGVCCVHPDYSKIELKEYDNQNNILEELRENLLSGNIEGLHKECLYCTARYKFDIDEVASNVDITKSLHNIMLGQNIEPRFLEIGLGNKCNNNCKMCDVSVSKNLYAPDEDYVHCNHMKDIDIKLEKSSISLVSKQRESIKLIEFVGGEPFLYMDTMYEVMDLCKNLKVVRLITNGSILDERFFEYLKNRGVKLYLSVSIDGTKKTQSYLRGWSNYNNVIKNINIINEKYDNVSTSINTVISILNIFDLDNVIRELRENIKEWFNINFLIVRCPSYYSIASVDDNNIRLEMMNILKKYKDDRNINGVLETISYLENEINSSEITKEKILYTLDFHDKRINLYSKDYLNKRIYEYLGGE